MGIFLKIKNAFKNAMAKDTFKMVTDVGNGFYAFDGKLYQSDIVRACMRPEVKAIGKLTAKHIRETVTDTEKKVEVNPQPYIRFLLEDPNPFMSGQMLQEKVANQLLLNNNAFILIVSDSFGMPCGLYPIPACGVEVKYIDELPYLKFYYENGKSSMFAYSEIIHIRDDYFSNDIFGSPPGPALTELMNIVTTADQGIIKAIQNGAAVKWLLKLTQSLRDEDIISKAENFAKQYLNLSTKTFGVAAVDAKAEATQIKPYDYVPNAAQSDKTIDRIYAFFNTNRKIVMSDYTEDEWISYYESRIEPKACQMANEFTRKLFTRNQRAYGNKIMFEASNLTFASMKTKLNLVQFVDRGIMSPNEVRYYLNLAPVDGGDDLVRRLDTAKIEGKEKKVDEEN